jgi:hypothetical protein
MYVDSSGLFLGIHPGTSDQYVPLTDFIEGWINLYGNKRGRQLTKKIKDRNLEQSCRHHGDPSHFRNAKTHGDNEAGSDTSRVIDIYRTGIGRGTGAQLQK